MILSCFGVNFEHTENSPAPVCFPIENTAHGNENTDKLKAIYTELMYYQPEITVCDEKKPFEGDDRVTAIFFSGANNTKVFAYIGFPENVPDNSTIPAMVLVHGGSEHANADWVQYWVDKGYASISADYFGQIPTDGYYDECEWIQSSDHPAYDGLEGHDKPLEEQWFFYYIADTIIANSIMRADKRINSDKIGITGVSWGGRATICYDSRFAFAVPVYGCGYLNESKGIFYSIMSDKGVADVWEPSLLLSEVKMPVLWVSGDSDIFFSADALTKSAVTTENSELIIIPNMPHGQNPAAYSNEVYRYVQAQNYGGDSNIKVKKISFDGRRAIMTLDIPADVECVSISVYYMKGEIEYTEENELITPWQKSCGIVHGSNAYVQIPEGAKYFYVSVTGMVGNIFKNDYVHGSTGVFVSENVLEK